MAAAMTPTIPAAAAMTPINEPVLIPVASAPAANERDFDSGGGVESCFDGVVSGVGVGIAGMGDGVEDAGVEAGVDTAGVEVGVDTAGVGMGAGPEEDGDGVGCCDC